MLRVAVDRRSLADGSRHRGIGTYLSAILDGLSIRSDIDVVNLAAAPDTSNGRLGQAAAWWRHELALPGEIARSAADVFHSPGQHPPRRSTLPWVQTLFDLIPLVRNDPSMRTYRARWRRL